MHQLTPDTECGYVFDIQRYSIHDGPGIRTLVFLKGCPLKCLWCCNPESQKANPELAFFPDRCIGCKKCIQACPFNAISIRDGLMHTERKFCAQCQVTKSGELPCSSVCVSKARTTMGKLMKVTDVLKEVLREQVLYKKTGGGVTISGGEPLSQPDFLFQLLKAFRQNWLHTAIETSGCGKWENLQDVLEFLNLVFFDLKAYDLRLHRELTGVENTLILTNAKAMTKYIKERNLETQVTFRIPIIPGYTETHDVLKILDFVSEELRDYNIEFMAYHRLGRGKYATLDKEYLLADLEPPKEEMMDNYKKEALKRGLNIVTL